MPSTLSLKQDVGNHLKPELSDQYINVLEVGPSNFHHQFDVSQLLVLEKLGQRLTAVQLVGAYGFLNYGLKSALNAASIP